MNIDKRVRICLLFDFYGELLTDKQQYSIKRYYDDDASLAEIATELNISRQAVRDSIVTSENMLESFELKLGLVERYNNLKNGISEIIDELESSGYSDQTIDKIKQLYQYL